MGAMRTRVLLLLATTALVLAGCGEGSTDSPTVSATSATAGATTAAADAGPSPTGDNIDPAALCAYLKGELPEWKAIGSEVGALAQATIGIADWYDKNSQSKIPDRDELDAATKAECPDTRAEVLKTIGVESFLQL
jgi:hypothetical protein